MYLLGSVTSYVKGETFRNYNKKYGFGSKEIVLICYHMSFILRDLQEKILFNHNDLHEDNVMIEVTEPKRYNYFCANGSYTSISPFSIKIIDFGRSYVEGINEGYYDGIVSPNITPGIYDPCIDIAFLATWNYDILYDGPSFILPKALEEDKLINDYGVNIDYPPIIHIIYRNNKVFEKIEYNFLNIWIFCSTDFGYCCCNQYRVITKFCDSQESISYS